MSRNVCPLKKGLYLVGQRIADVNPHLDGERRPGGEVHPGFDKIRYGNVMEQDGEQYIAWEDEMDNPVIRKLSEYEDETGNVVDHPKGLPEDGAPTLKE